MTRARATPTTVRNTPPSPWAASRPPSHPHQAPDAPAGAGATRRGGANPPTRALDRAGPPTTPLGSLEHPPRSLRGPQSVALADQHRRMERLRASVDPSRGLPAKINLEPIRRLPIRQTL